MTGNKNWLKVPKAKIPAQVIGFCVDCRMGFIAAREGQRFCSDKCRLATGIANFRARQQGLTWV